MDKILTILGAPRKKGVSDEVTAFEARVKAWAAANAAKADVTVKAGTHDLMALFDDPQTLGDMTDFNIIVIVGHGAPGALYFDSAKVFARRMNLKGTRRFLDRVRLPQLDGLDHSQHWLRRVLEECGSKNREVEVVLVGCDFGSNDGAVTATSPGALTAVALKRALDDAGLKTRILFTSGRVLAANASEVLQLKSLYEVEALLQPNGLSATLSVKQTPSMLPCSVSAVSFAA